MKTKGIGIGACLLLLTSLIASPVLAFSPETIGKKKIGVVVKERVVLDKKFKTTSEKILPHVGNVHLVGSVERRGEIDHFYFSTIGVKYGLLDNLEISAEIGTADGETKQDYSGTVSWSGPYGPRTGLAIGTAESRYKTNNAFIYSIGLKATKDLVNDWFMGMNVQYMRHKHNYKATLTGCLRDTASGNTLPIRTSWDGKLTFQEVDVTPYLAKRIKTKIGKFVPYVGADYAYFRMKDSMGGDTNKRIKIKADKEIGVMCGLDYSSTGNGHWSLNVEGRFINETAVNMGATYKF